MARPRKSGIDYFSLDSDFFSDIKIKLLYTRYGADGITLYIYLLCEIYKEGYYLKWNKDTKFIVSHELNMSEQKVEQIMKFLLERSLLNDKLFQSDTIITSAGIQKRYQEAVEWRGRKNPVEIEKYWVLDKKDTKPWVKVAQFEVIPEKNGGYSKETPEKNIGYSKGKQGLFQTKVKESKVKESKVNKSKVKESKVNKSKVKEIKNKVNKIENKRNQSLSPLEQVYEDYKKLINHDSTEEELLALRSIIDEFGISENLLRVCIKEAASKDIKSISYIKGIVQNLYNNNIRNTNDLTKNYVGGNN